MSNKIKIAVNTRFLIQDKLEGIGTYSHQVLSRLVKLMPNVEFHFLFDRQWSEEFVYADNIIPHKIGFPARHPLLWYLWFEFALPKWLKNNNVDLFISPDSFLSLSTEINTILVMHDLAFEHFPDHNGFFVRNYYKYFFPKFAKRANRILAVSEFTKQDIVTKYNISKQKIGIAYCGVSNLYMPISLSEKDEIKSKISFNEAFFICIGSLNPRKNISSAVKAFNLFKKENKSKIKLLIVGAKGWKTTKLFNEIENSYYKNDIIKTGHLKPQVLSKYLAASEGLIFPSLFEGFGIPILEAVHCNVPVITSNVSSTKEIGEGIAILVDPNNIKAITKAMKNILEKDFIKQNNKKVYEQKISLYNWDRTAIIFRNIINESITFKA